jgi:hypothetical protein
MHKRLLASLALLLAGCAGDLDKDAGDGQSVTVFQEGLSGCRGVASSAKPASGNYFLTSFGFTPGADDGTMSCGSNTRHGTWYYAASRQRFGCGAHIQIEARGKCVIAQTDDYGPDVCVESAAGAPIIDASPLVSEQLFGTRSAGWSDRFPVHVTEVARSTPLGPCASGGAAPPPPPAPTPTPPPSTCHSATLDQTVAAGTCVQSASDGAWYKCSAGVWQAGQSSCSASYAWCSSATLGHTVPPRTCVQARADRVWYQCAADGWEAGGASGSGPLGACSSEHAL